MSATVFGYAAYLVIALPLAVWVARTLHRNGRIFLIEVFGGREDLADSVNHLLVVGFYLVNLGYVSVFLRASDEIRGAQETIEFLAWKLGMVLLALGGMHFLNLLVLGRMHKRHRYDVMDLTVGTPGLQ